MAICNACMEDKEMCAKGMCRQCYMRKYYEENKEERKAYQRRYDRAHREEKKEYHRKWREDNPNYYVESVERRRAMKVGSSIGSIDVDEISRECLGRCFYCGSEQDLTIDHVVPLSRGGEHVMDNLVIACRSCNSSKNSADLFEWARRPENRSLRIWLL